MLKVKEAASMLDVCPETIRRLLRKGELHGTRECNRTGWLINEDELCRYAAEHGICHEALGDYRVNMVLDEVKDQMAVVEHELLKLKLLVERLDLLQ